MQTKLGHIANIQFGIHQTNQVKGAIKYLLVKHFDEDFQPTLFADSYIEENTKTVKALLQPNDVLFTGKGFRQFAWTYQESFGAVVPSSVFYVLQPDTSIILPEYLTIILNSEKMRHTFRMIGLGVAIPSIPKTELKEIKISIPPLEQQQKIIAFAEWHQKEISLTKVILQKKKDIFNSYLKQAID